MGSRASAVTFRCPTGVQGVRRSAGPHAPTWWLQHPQPGSQSRGGGGRRGRELQGHPGAQVGRTLLGLSKAGPR